MSYGWYTMLALAAGACAAFGLAVDRFDPRYRTRTIFIAASCFLPYALTDYLGGRWAVPHGVKLIRFILLSAGCTLGVGEIVVWQRERRARRIRG